MNREIGSFTANNTLLIPECQPAVDKFVSPTPISSEVPHQYSDFTALGNPELPIYAQKREFIEAIVANQVVIVIAPTGTGKSTQSVQYALEAGFDRVYMSQPRRRAAHNVAERVSFELDTVLGKNQGAELVSCQTGAGLIGQYGVKAQVMTEGVLRIRDTYQPSSGDNELWILDEVHEGSNEMWILQGIAKQRVAENPNFTVVVMTATPNKYDTINYWTNEVGIEPTVIELGGGNNFEIQLREEPESTTVNEAVKAAIDIYENPDNHDSANTIQVFEAGKREIKDTIDGILRQLPEPVREKTRILPNHAKLTPAAQQPVYEDYDGIKIVVQTNIGKTSMTIPRTRYVITSGTERMIELDSDDVPALLKTPSSQDCMVQEMGRAGRTSSGVFIHTRNQGEAFVSMAERPPHLEPEILRSKVDTVIMGLALRGENIRDFDSNPAMPIATLERSVRRLQLYGALDGQERLTKLGSRMGKYPASPENQRALVEAEQYSEQIRLCMAAMVAAAEVGGLRLFQPGSVSWEKLTDETSSDMFANLETFINIQRKRINQLTSSDLDKNNAIRAEELYRKIARRAGIEQIPNLKLPSVKEREILRDCIVRGYINSAHVPQGDGEFKAVNGMQTQREISNRSVVSPHTRHAVVGNPFNVEIERDSERYLKPIIENVTEVPMRELGKYMVKGTAWQATGFRLRAGNFVQIEQQIFGNQVLSSREVPAEPSPMLRATLMEHVRSSPGKNLIGLYEIKSELERLARRTRFPVQMFTEDAINELINEAVTDGVVAPDHVDDNLRRIIEERSLTLDSFVSTQQRSNILANSPDKIDVEGYELKLRYSQGKPTARRYTVEMVEGLESEPSLADGRQVYFMLNNKPYTLQQLRNKLHAAGEI